MFVDLRGRSPTISMGCGLVVIAGRQQHSRSTCPDLLRLRSSVMMAGNTKITATTLKQMSPADCSEKTRSTGMGNKAATKNAQAVDAPLNSTLSPLFFRI